MKPSSAGKKGPQYGGKGMPAPQTQCAKGKGMKAPQYQATPEQLQLAAAQVEHAKVRRLQANSYSVRRSEGRPVHGQTSWAFTAIGVVCSFLQFWCLVMPYWRANFIYSLGYPMTRAWGLFHVSGQRSQWHHTMATDTCAYFGTFNLGGLCLSPICRWYQVKCTTYIDMAYLMYFLGFLQILVFLFIIFTTIWVFKLSPRLIRWSATWLPVLSLLHPGIMFAYYMITEDLFGILDHYSVYPVPPPSFCFYASILVSIMLMTNTVLSFTLKAIWPEPSIETDSEDDSDSDDGLLYQQQQQQHFQQHQMYPAQQADGMHAMPHMPAPHGTLHSPAASPGQMSQGQVVAAW